MKNWFKSLALFTLTIFLFSSTVADNGNSMEARVNTYKHECKQMLKPARYEGSRITYYSLQKEATVKSVESYLVLDTEYKFVFSGKECTTKVGVKIYDSADAKKRVMLKEIKNIQGKNISVSSNELLPVFRKKVSATERMKTVVVEYTIAGGKTKQEAIVMVVGYKD
ncbi:MAG: hypothetical protein ACK5B9_01295 [Flavobacteriia bacterium]|jgi:hypothetical protein